MEALLAAASLHEQGRQREPYGTGTVLMEGLVLLLCMESSGLRRDLDRYADP